MVARWLHGVIHCDGLLAWQVVANESHLADPAALEWIYSLSAEDERRRRRLESSGETDEDLPWKTLCFPPGKRLSIAETLRLGRQLAYERNSARALAKAQIPTDIPS